MDASAKKDFRYVLALDIGSNSVGSAWIDRRAGIKLAGTSIFPAGVDESDDKRGDPKNAKRRMTRRTRITLARRSERKRELRLKLIETGLLPQSAEDFKTLLEMTDPWALRRKGLEQALTPHEFGRILLHMAQRRGAMGLSIPLPDEDEDQAKASDDGKVKAAIGAVRQKMLEAGARTFGEFIAMERDKRVCRIKSKDQRPASARNGPREFRDAVRNKAGSYEHCADRAMIRHEFDELWKKQQALRGKLSKLLTDDLRLALDDERGDSVWKHKGLLFGQRRQTWDLGTLGRCVLEPTERCAPHADMHASRYLVVETINNLRIIERDQPVRPLTPEERQKIKAYLSGPLGVVEKGKLKGKPKHTVSVTDLRELMGWGRASKTSPFRFNIESDEHREINTDWFSREIIHGAIGAKAWEKIPENVREGINRELLRLNPEEEGEADKLRAGVMKWGGLNKEQADKLIAAWTRRPRLDVKRLNMSRRAVLNVLKFMDRPEPWPDAERSGQLRWLTQIEARKMIAEDGDFRDVTTGTKLDEHSRRRYATGAKGLSARDRHYLRKHDGDLPPAPMITNPVVRKAIHEVRRHIVEYMRAFGRKPDEIYIELAREARMGAKQADEVLFKNRLRNRIRKDIAREFELDSVSGTQERAAVDRVILCVQQGGVCPLCGNQVVKKEITPRHAADGTDCEVAHIIPRAGGGHNGLGNLVLAHTKCNRDMARRTPRQFWEAGPGFEAGIRWVEGIFGEIKRPKPSEIKSAKGASLWSCYFNSRDDNAKIEQFKKDIKDIQEMTNRQDAATKYAARQVMAYLADALYDGKGLPERGGERRIYASDGLWTSRLRREWGLFFDRHGVKDKGLSNEQEHERREKNRGDHRHHAIDAVVIGYATPSLRIRWEDRERAAERDLGHRAADPEAMEHYRRRNPLHPPEPYKSIDEFREAVRVAVYGETKSGEPEKPICHRPVKRKLIGALHEETLFGPVLDAAGNPTGCYTAKKSVQALDSNHLRMPRNETESEAIERLSARYMAEKGVDEKAARKWARSVVGSKSYTPTITDPPPGKSGIVRDIALRGRLRECVEQEGLDPDDFKANDVKKLFEAGKFKHASGVPIRSMVLLRTMSDPVVITRRRQDYATGRIIADENPASARAYVGGNNHHIEIRAALNKSGKPEWTGTIVSAFEASRRKLAKLHAFKAQGVPKPEKFRERDKKTNRLTMSSQERARWNPVIATIEAAYPLVDRADNAEKGGEFVMSLCEGEMLLMRSKNNPDEVGYFVVAKLDKPQTIVLVPHWDARKAGERKDSEGKPVPDSAREQFGATPTDLLRLAPPGHKHAVKVRVSPLGHVTITEKD